MALSKKKRKIVLLIHDGHIIRGNLRPDGKFVYRVLTDDNRPLFNISEKPVRSLIATGVLKATMEGVKLDKVKITKARRVFV